MWQIVGHNNSCWSQTLSSVLAHIKNCFLSGTDIIRHINSCDLLHSCWSQTVWFLTVLHTCVMPPFVHQFFCRSLPSCLDVAFYDRRIRIPVSPVSHFLFMHSGFSSIFSYSRVASYDSLSFKIRKSFMCKIWK